MQEHEELVWLARNFKLELTKYSRQIYGPSGFAHLGDGNGDDDDDDDGNDDVGGAGGSETTPNYQSRKRCH